ncbi:MAG: hypothetical protein L0I76_03025 [Pseudonocardia sp.]|nr:hypothetical protein [Pseudonocardia sp.]
MTTAPVEPAGIPETGAASAHLIPAPRTSAEATFAEAAPGQATFAESASGEATSHEAASGEASSDEAGSDEATSADATRSVPPATARPDVRLCRCGHADEVHEHYRRGTDCGVCGPERCRSFRPTGRRGGASARD